MIASSTYNMQILILLFCVFVVVQSSGQLRLHIRKNMCKRAAPVEEDVSSHEHKLDIVVTLKGGEQPPTTVYQEPTTELFTCVKPGSFPNPENCSDFFICHKNEVVHGLERVKMSCPRGMAFDQNKKKCTAGAILACLSPNNDNGSA